MGELDSYIFYYDNQTHCAHARRMATVHRSRFGSAVANYSKVQYRAWCKGTMGNRDSGFGIWGCLRQQIYDVRCLLTPALEAFLASAPESRIPNPESYFPYICPVKKTLVLYLFFISAFVCAQQNDSLRKADSIQKALYTIQNQYKNNNALPYAHCPLEIKFEPYDSVAGYILLYDTSKVLYLKLDIYYPAYHYLIFEACDWSKQKYTAYLYSKYGNKLNSFVVANPPQNGQVGNVGPFKDLRKIRKHKYKFLRKVK